MSKSKTRKQMVLDELRRELEEPWRNDGWVRAHHLVHPSVGGTEGLRRLRELRADGHNIEMRRRPGTHPGGKRYTEREYRLVVKA